LHNEISGLPKAEEVERELQIMLKPRPDIQNFSKVLFHAQSVVLVSANLRRFVVLWQRRAIKGSSRRLRRSERK
jgi:hypothetical protein